MIHYRDLRRVAREVRNAIGIERTPDQIENFLHANSRSPQRVVRAALADSDVMLDLANKMRIPYLEKAPPSSELLP